MTRFYSSAVINAYSWPRKLRIARSAERYQALKIIYRSVRCLINHSTNDVNDLLYRNCFARVYFSKWSL